MDFDGTLMEVPLPLVWDSVDDTLMSTFEVHTAFPNELDPETWPRESAGRVLRIAEIFQRVASLEEVENQDLTSAHYAGCWTRVGPWLPYFHGQERHDRQAARSAGKTYRGTFARFLRGAAPGELGVEKRFELQRIRARQRASAAAGERSGRRSRIA